MKHPHKESPVNPLPPVVWALFLLTRDRGSLLARRAGADRRAGCGRLADRAIERFGFNGPIFDWMLQTGQYPAEHLLRFFAYPFVHAAFTHTLFVAVILLAMGKIVGELLGAVATLAVFFLSSVGGALTCALMRDTRLADRGLSARLRPDRRLHLPALGAARADGCAAGPRLHPDRLPDGPPAGLRRSLRSNTDWVADLAGFARSR